MGLTTAGATYAAGAIVGVEPTLFNNANARLGVGDSATAFAAAQTDLQAATNKLRKVMDATFPTRTTNVLTFQSTFTTAEANFAWAEWGVFNTAAAGPMLNRFVQALGTKTAAQSWQLTVTLTFTAA
jgi:hypothetical protein